MGDAGRDAGWFPRGPLVSAEGSTEHFSSATDQGWGPQGYESAVVRLEHRQGFRLKDQVRWHVTGAGTEGENPVPKRRRSARENPSLEQGRVYFQVPPPTPRPLPRKGKGELWLKSPEILFYPQDNLVFGASAHAVGFCFLGSPRLSPQATEGASNISLPVPLPTPHPPTHTQLEGESLRILQNMSKSSGSVGDSGANCGFFTL